MKKKLLSLLAAFSALFLFGSCSGLQDKFPNLPFFPSSDVEESSSTPSTSGDSSSNGGGAVEDTEALATLQAAYALQDGETMSATLTGVITEINKVSEGDVCLTIVVGSYTDYPMYCYWLQDADFVKVGDTITVTGEIKNYQGIIEFNKPTLVTENNGGSGNTGNNGGNSGNVDDTAALAILKAAYALQDGETIKNQTLTGVITEIEKTGEGDVCLTFVVGSYTEYPMYCYWLQDADFVKVGNTITVTGEIKNYQGVIEFNKPTLVTENNGGSGNTGNNSGNSGNVEDTDALATLKAAYALATGTTLKNQTLTGVITDIEKTGTTGDVCLTFVVGNYTQYPMYCFWLQHPGEVKVGDTITVTGNITNYDGLIEFHKPTLVSHTSGNGGSSSGNSGNTDSSTTHTYTAFNATDKALFKEYFDQLIPFIPNDDYILEEYEMEWEDGTVEVGLNFYTTGNTKAEFNAYLNTLRSTYTFDYQEEDDYGDTWYCFTADEYYLDVAYYADEDNTYYVDVYAYIYLEEGTGSSGSEDTTLPSNLITNAGKGLPSAVGGEYTVDFTKASYVKNVTEQGSYLDGCPTLGSPAVLVVPVEFSDVTAASKGYSISTIEKAFNGGANDTDYYSVHDYYYASSYGKLDLDITVLDFWFRPKYQSTYYANATMDYYGSQVMAGDQLIIDELLASLEGTMDLTKFDSDGNTVIDAIVLINTLDVDDQSNFQWAYRYWNIYTDENDYYYEYDGVSANDFIWAPYQFMHESYDEEDSAIYDDTSVLNTYTYIHEFGHVLGADDYYDTSYAGNTPMDGADIMDSGLGDHNAFTKFNYGWLTSSRLVVTDTSVTLTLEEFSKNGDTIILANNWDEKLGVYQEYYILAYYTGSGLNGGDYGYFARDGIVVYHVNASLYAEAYGEETYYDIYNNNTDASDSYGTADNLIEYVKSANDTFTYIEGDTMSKVTDDQGNALIYNFVVDSFNNGVATITFTKK